jgi:hypothetical protein
MTGELRLLFQNWECYLGNTDIEASIIYGEAIVSKIPGNRVALDRERESSNDGQTDSAFTPIGIRDRGRDFVRITEIPHSFALHRVINADFSYSMAQSR